MKERVICAALMSWYGKIKILEPDLKNNEKYYIMYLWVN